MALRFTRFETRGWLVKCPDDFRTIPIGDPAFLASLHVALRVTPTAAGGLTAEVADLWETARRGDVELSPIFACGDAGRLQAAVVTVHSPGATSLLLLSAVGPEVPLVQLAQCLHVAKTYSLARGDRLIEVLLDSTTAWEDRWHRPLTQTGFQFLTSLFYLSRQLDAVVAEPSLPADLTWLSYTPENEPLFLRALEDSYAQTLDCPELTGIRTTAEVLAGHRAAGEFDPALWTLAMRGGKPVGVGLLTPLRQRAATEITYLGVAQTARGTGVADALTAHAIAQSREVNAKVVALAVDVRNVPARRLYARWGFQRFQQRDVWIAASAQVLAKTEVGIRWPAGA